VCRDSEHHDDNVRRASTCRVKRIVAAGQFSPDDTALRARPLDRQPCSGRYGATELAHCGMTRRFREGRQPERSACRSRGPELYLRRAREKTDVRPTCRVSSVRRIDSTQTRGVRCRTVPSGSPWHSMRARGGRDASGTRYPGTHGSWTVHVAPAPSVSSPPPPSSPWQICAAWRFQAAHGGARVMQTRIMLSIMKLRPGSIQRRTGKISAPSSVFSRCAHTMRAQTSQEASRNVTT
jgi:hypothetical protein